MHCIVKDVVGNPPDKNGTRCRFQMDLAVALMSHGVSLLDWKDPTKDKHPSFVRGNNWDWIPCDCLKAKSPQVHCYFCSHGHIHHGIDHKSPGQKKNTPSKKRLQCKRHDLGYSAYCEDCVDEVKAEEPGITLAVARRRVGAKAKLASTIKASGKF